MLADAVDVVDDEEEEGPAEQVLIVVVIAIVESAVGSELDDAIALDVGVTSDACDA